MPTYEDRLDKLETRVTSLELERLYEQRKATESLPPEQTSNVDDINRNMTILLGIASGQERAIRTIRADLDIVKGRVARMDDNITSLNERVDGLDKKVDGLDKKVDGLDKRVDGLDKKVDGLDKKVDGLDKKVDKRFGALEDKFDRRFVSLEGKVDQIFQILTRLTSS